MSWINTDCKFKEYMVRQIDNVLFRMPMDLSDYSIKFSDREDLNPILNQVFDFAREVQSKSQMIDKNGKVVPVDPYKHPRAFQSYIATNIECHVLPVIYSLIVKHDQFDFMRFRGDFQSLHYIHRKFIEWNDNDCSEERFADIVDEFYHLFDKSFEVTYRRTQGKIGRNEQCPCGSGKKWKKCCGKRT